MGGSDVTLVYYELRSRCSWSCKMERREIGHHIYRHIRTDSFYASRPIVDLAVHFK